MFTLKSKLLGIFVLLALMLSFAAAYVSGIISPMLRGKAETAIMNHITDLVASALEESELERTPLNISYGESGRITSCSLDSTYSAHIRAYMSRVLSQELSSELSLECDARFGDITGLSFLYGRGARICCTFEAYGGITLDVESELNEAGINQTLHRSVLNIHATFYVKQPLDAGRIELDTSIPLSETLILGEVPEAYTVIIRAAEEDEADINDYAAQAG